MGIEFKDRVQERVELTESSSHKPEHLHIEIDASPSYASVLTAIFASSLAEMVPTLPSYWQPYAQANFLTQPVEARSPTPAQPAGSRAVAKIGGAVLPPQVLHQVEPRFTEAARQVVWSGHVILRVVVTDQGNAEDTTIVRPLGLGLDEEAVAAMSRYTFRPATEEGTPIPVEVTMDVNFQIFPGPQSSGH